MKKLPIEFYEQTDVVEVARTLLGKIVVTRIAGALVKARIVETEAYVAMVDKASHAYAGKRTARNEAMYARGGTAYVYICYGLHRMLNVVTNSVGIPDAVLIRGAEPLAGLDVMARRTGRDAQAPAITRGPGNLARALGIEKEHTGLSLLGNCIYLADDGFIHPPELIGVSKRIGIDGAGEDAALPYRFYTRGNRFVSAAPVK